MDKRISWFLDSVLSPDLKACGAHGFFVFGWTQLALRAFGVVSETSVCCRDVGSVVELKRLAVGPIPWGSKNVLPFGF